MNDAIFIPQSLAFSVNLQWPRIRPVHPILRLHYNDEVLHKLEESYEDSFNLYWVIPVPIQGTSIPIMVRFRNSQGQRKPYMQAEVNAVILFFHCSASFYNSGFRGQTVPPSPAASDVKINPIVSRTLRPFRLHFTRLFHHSSTSESSNAPSHSEDCAFPTTLHGQSDGLVCSLYQYQRRLLRPYHIRQRPTGDARERRFGDECASNNQPCPVIFDYTYHSSSPQQSPSTILRWSTPPILSHPPPQIRGVSSDSGLFPFSIP